MKKRRKETTVSQVYGPVFQVELVGWSVGQNNSFKNNFSLSVGKNDSLRNTKVSHSLRQILESIVKFQKNVQANFLRLWGQFIIVYLLIYFCKNDARTLFWSILNHILCLDERKVTSIEQFYYCKIINIKSHLYCKIITNKHRTEQNCIFVIFFSGIGPFNPVNYN